MEEAKTMIQIEGRYVKENDEVEYGKWSVEEIADFIKNGHFAMISLSGYYLGKKMKNRYASASALTLFPEETILFSQESDIIIPTFFRNMYLPYEMRTENEDELVPVNCIVESNDKNLFITITKK